MVRFAVLALCGPVYAQQDPEVAALAKPQSAVSVGAGIVSGNQRDRALFGQYSGLRLHETNLLIDLDYVTRDDATGTWTTIRGRNIGLDLSSGFEWRPFHNDNMVVLLGASALIPDQGFKDLYNEYLSEDVDLLYASFAELTLTY